MSSGTRSALERDRNRAAEGAFQQYVVLMEHMVTPIPDDVAFEQAAVLPLTLSTAATGMFQQDHLGLAMPSLHPVDRNETVLVWGGSTCVGSNAVQLARCAGYRVVATSSPRNFDYLRSLGAAETVDYHSRTAAEELVELIGDSPLAGTLAITAGSIGTESVDSLREPQGAAASRRPALRRWSASSRSEEDGAAYG